MSKSASPFLQATLFLIILTLTLEPITTADLGWHLAAGKFIVTNQSLPYFDTFTFSLPGHPYIAYSWLTEVIIYLFYTKLNLWGITLTLASTTALGLYLQYFTTKKLLTKPVLAVLILPLIPFFIIFASLRTHAPTILCLSILSYILINYPSKTPLAVKPWALKTKFIYLPFLFFLWANLHAGFALGLFILIIWITSKIIRYQIKQKSLQLTQSHKHIILFLFLSASATLLNPYQLQLHKFIYNLTFNSSTHHFNKDWLPLFSTNFSQAFQIFPLLLSLQTFITLKYTKRYQHQKLIIFILFLLTLKSVRFAMPLLIFMTPLFIKSIEKIFLTKNNHLKLSSALPLILLAIPIYKFQKQLISQTICTNNSINCYAQFGNYPLEAINYLKQNNIQGNILNHYNWGGFLLWQLPQNKYYADGRMDNFFKNNHSFLDEFTVIAFGQPGWQQIIFSYPLDAILMPSSWPLRIDFQQNPNWELVYQDEISLIFVPIKTD